MTGLFEELQRAIMRGFTLAAVSASLSCTKAPVPAQPPVPSRLHQLDGGKLAQVPSGALHCLDDGNKPFYGPCCTGVHCYTPANETCVAASELKSQNMTPRLPIGSGTCACGQTQGPFAQIDGGVTECCYVVGTRGCSGRPLREGESAVVAAVVGRSDWA